MTPSQHRSTLCLLLLPLLLLPLAAGLLSTHPAAAQGDAVSELINAINALRASHGLAPYSVDPQLMAMAQEHSAFQAAIHTSTHQHSDGRVPRELGVAENVAGGDLGYLDAQAAVYEIWADPVHMRAMVGFPAGLMGVGVADDGITVYYTLEVRSAASVTSTAAASGAEPGAGSSTGKPPGAGTAAVPAATIPFAALHTVTPRADGAVLHRIGYGQTLWSIALAYGVTVDQIRAWNNIPAGSNDIYAGNTLLIYPPGAFPQASPTAVAQVDAVTNPTAAQNSALTSDPPGSEQFAPVSAVGQPAADATQAQPAGAETAAGLIPPSSTPSAAAESLAPWIALASILAGGGLLLVLRFARKAA